MMQITAGGREDRTGMEARTTFTVEEGLEYLAAFYTWGDLEGDPDWHPIEFQVMVQDNGTWECVYSHGDYKDKCSWTVWVEEGALYGEC